MNRILFVALFFGSMVLAGCNTFSGMGKDMQETGDFIGGTSPRDAYHQDARDF